jgi:hypothetical protein
MQRLPKHLFREFIICSSYGKRGGYWPNRTILLSDLKVDCKTKDIPILSETEEFFKEYRNKKGIHAEENFLQGASKIIEKKELQGRQVNGINAKLILNYSPCWKCSDAIIEFIEVKERKGIEWEFTIQFTNLYRHFDYSNISGLQRLELNGVKLEFMHGEHMLGKFITKYGSHLSQDERREFLELAMSFERKRNEQQGLEIFFERIVFYLLKKHSD